MWRFTDPDLEQLHKVCRMCPIFLLLDEEQRVCELTNCSHHIFFEGIKKLNPSDTEHTRLMRNCVTHGVSNVGEMTLEEIAAIYNMSRERVRQIIDKLLFGRKGIGMRIQNTPALRSEFNVTAKKMANFKIEADRVEGQRKTKDDYTVQCRSEKRRVKKCLTRRSRITSGQIRRLNP